MTLLIVLIVALLQSLATIALAGSGILRTLGLRPGVGEIVLLLPSVIAFVANSRIILASSFIRTDRVVGRVVLVLCCTTVLSFVAFAVAMIVSLNTWGS